ncbi:hypothetical protein [Azospirillum sp.]|uniref:hypothetical protein n=1 Tax=Azospirillum sp. TaxID=34012 RepID=UPI002D583105|nr:hypothetical protein [Azospirillum sp.]HYD66880.1 hypothetical protein [Azospirillum sp.]
MRPSALISILSWEQPRYLANLLDNLDGVSPTFEGRVDYHVHVLDQGSGPETVDVVKAFVARGGNRSASLLTRNVGFAHGHNLVFDHHYRRRRFDYFVVLNQDVLFGRATWLDRLVDGMADEGVGIGGPSAWRLNPGGGGMTACLRGVARPDDVYSIQASVAILRTGAIERFGLFDTAFTPAYFEDTDLCRRYAAAGLRMAWIDIEHVHAYFGTHRKLLRERHAELAERFGDFRRRNERLFCERWLPAPPTAVTPDDVPCLWPGVYRPAVPLNP